MRNATRLARSKAAMFLGAAAVGLAVIIGFIAIRAHAPVQEGSTPVLTPARRPAASSTEGLPAAPDVEIVMYQGDAAVGGSKIRLSQLWGKGRPAVLNYFAGLCPPCRAELPDFQRLYADSAKDKFTLIGVDIGSFVGLGSRDDGKALLRELKITFPAGTISADGFHKLGILGMPTTVFITADGKILKKYTGMLTRDQMNTFVGELLKASGAS
jgi:cytochrome c biogenesis protein CcmG, thiol:disulfide interchange protein DsbE